MKTRVWSLSQQDPPEKGMAIHSSILAWRIPWTEEPGGPQSMGLQRVRHDWTTNFLNKPGFASLLLRWGKAYRRDAQLRLPRSCTTVTWWALSEVSWGVAQGSLLWSPGCSGDCKAEHWGECHAHSVAGCLPYTVSIPFAFFFPLQSFSSSCLLF